MVDGIVMPTIRGTGSLFVRDLLSPPYERTTLRQDEPPEYPLVFDHLYPMHMPHFYRWIARYPTIVMPIRRPESVAATWAKRGEQFSTFFEMWELWADLAPSALILPVDHEGARDKALQDISDAIGISLSTNWEPVNRTKVSRGTSDDIPFEDVRELYNIPIIGELYG